jgi:ABC-type nitrate/sulfonate/bicarbonate transport system substrate-binding protein
MTTFRKLPALLGIAFIVCTASSKHSWGQTQTLTAFYTAPVVSMAPMWIAKEVGFFKKYGLDVRVVFIPSGPTGTTAILAGEADVGVIGGFAPIRAIVGGAKGLAIVGQTKNAIVATIVGKQEIATVQDLK